MTSGGNTGTASARYAALYNAREPFLIRAREAAQLTKPYLMPPLGFNGTQSLPTPYQSLGARGVRNLASKMLLALFPTNTTFFRYEVDDFVLEKLGAARGEFDKAMSRRERAIGVEIDKARFRGPAYTAFEHLIVAGNGLIYVPPDKGPVRFYRLDQYVVRRDPMGNVLEIVIEEKINPLTLPAAQRSLVTDDGSIDTKPDSPAEELKDVKDPHSGTGDKDVCLYTRIFREDDGDWNVYQECKGIIFPDSVGTYKPDLCPFIPLRFSHQPGEDYGRGYVEELLGDLDSLEALSQTLVEGTAAVARVLFLVKPNGMTRVKVVAAARNGDVKVGNAEDVTVVQAQNKSADFQTAQKQAQEISTRLSYAFMLNSSVQRNGERVTAEEIRYMAGELDDALGGVYTLLSDEYQLPVALLFERRMMKNRKVPPIPSSIATPTITTGMQALGRGNDLQNLKGFLQDVVQVLTPQVAMQYLMPSEFLSRAAAAYNLDTDGLIKPPDQVAQEQQQAQQQAQMSQLAPHAIRAGGQIAAASMKAQQPQGSSDASS